MSKVAIDVEDLRKVFKLRERVPGVGALRQLFSPRMRESVAVDSVPFRIAEGERVAFIGQNGAGKSTTIKMLSGALHPSAGGARVAGLCPWREQKALSYRIGTVFGQRTQLWYHLPASDSFELLRHVYDQGGPAYEKRQRDLIEEFAIGTHLHKPVKQLSLGERMRCEVVASLLHTPTCCSSTSPPSGSTSLPRRPSVRSSATSRCALVARSC